MGDKKSSRLKREREKEIKHVEESARKVAKDGASTGDRVDVHTTSTGTTPPHHKHEQPSAATTAATTSTPASQSLPPKIKPPTPSISMMKPKECANCHRDLSRNIRITCAECVAPPECSRNASYPHVDFCVECFAAGCEVMNHKKDHKYMVSDCLAFPLVLEENGVVNADWTAEEELLLLEGIEMFGMGNWKDIAEHVGTKTERKCEVHYLSAYLANEDSMPRFQTDQDLNASKKHLKTPVQVSTTVTSTSVTSTPTSTPSKPPRGSESSTSGEKSIPRKNLASASVPSTPSGPSSTPILNVGDRIIGTELAGYMPLRGDFDVEYDNDAELILADMEFNEDDHPTERELKLKIIEIYNTKLDERERRKKFVIERGLLDYKRHQQMERRRPKEEREVIAQMRPFARFQSPEEHEQFVQGLITAMRLRKQIMMLQEYRKNGVRTLAEAELYEAEKKKRDTELAMQKQRESASYLYESGRPTTSGRDRASRWLNRDRTAPNANSSEATNSESKDANQSPEAGVDGHDDDKDVSKSFLIDGTPGSHLLTPKEKELCSRLKLLPKHYLVIKDALIRESYRLGYLTVNTASEMVKIDVEKTGQIYDFFVTCGWVATQEGKPPSSAANDAEDKSKSTSSAPLKRGKAARAGEEEGLSL